jgi:hypothetical protein
MNNMPHFARILARTALATSLQLLWAGQAAWAQAQPASPATEAEAEAEANDNPQEARVGKGDATRAWLGAQASRKQASGTRQTLSGPVMSKVHERYAKSFAIEIERTPIRADMPNTNR